MTNLPNKDFLRVDEVAIYFSVTKKTIYEWINRGHLEATKVGFTTLRITRESVLKCCSPPSKE
jgi:excisionase family DNA binding protein